MGVVPAHYALVGAAAMTGASTQTISAAVIAIEMTGAFGLQLPVFLASLAAYVVSRAFGDSIYDAMMIGRYQRYLPSIRTDIYYKLRAEDVMERNPITIPLRIHYRRVRNRRGGCEGRVGV
jgi:hypothetical protein